MNAALLLMFVASPMAGDDRTVVVVNSCDADQAAVDAATGIEAELTNLGWRVERVPRVAGEPCWTARETELANQAIAISGRAGVAIDDFRNLKLDAAQTTFEALEAELRALPVGRPPPELLDVYAYLGWIAIAKGEEKRARRLFRRALTLWPEWRPDPHVFSPEAIKALEAVAGEQAARKRVEVTVSSSRPGATATLDGRDQCATPCSFEARPGLHYLRVGRDGAIPKNERVTVKAKRTTRVEVKLEPDHRAALSAAATDDATLLAKLAELDVDRLILVTPSGAAIVGENVRRVRLDGETPRAVTDRLVIASSTGIAATTNAATSPPVAASVESPWYGRWYVWVTAGAVVVAAAGVATGAYLASQPANELRVELRGLPR